MRKCVALTAAGLAMALGTAAGYANGYAAHKPATVVRQVPMPQPSCPTEDSCRPLYANGHWTIVVDPG
jgi:hypothetical protein